LFKNLEIINDVNQNGVGFGLTISEKIITKLGGSLKLQNNSVIYQNEHMRGATAVIDFPIR